MTPWEMQTRRYLDMVRRQDRVVADLQQEKNRLEELIYSVGSPGITERVQTSTAADRTVKQLVELERKKEELAAACNAYVDFRLKVTEQIHKIADEKQRIILYQHYLQFKSLRIIAEEMHFDYSYVTMLRRKAITTFYRLNKETIEKTVS